ncbi:MAG: TlpA family protein disulfide reductase [Deltaproteobacteria bacterium]|nr:MAG: TlpA family protein disulfide reductase [Deltaproteobacteria bacterium]
MRERGGIPVKLTKRLYLSLLVVLLSLCCISLPASSTPAPKVTEVGQKVGNISFSDLDGKKFEMEDLLKKYRVVVINFWGLRCAACIQEMPHLQALHEKYGKRVKVLGVNVDAVDGGFLKEQMEFMGLKVSYTLVPDQEFKLIDYFGLNAAPLTIVVDGEGIVRYRHEDYRLGDEKELEKVVREILESGEK